MKIYISIPITGYDINAQKKEAEEMKTLLLSRGYHEVITPFDVCPEKGAAYSHYMGRDIEALLESDMVVFCKGWHESKGCRLEHHAAEIYDKIIAYYSEIENT